MDSTEQIWAREQIRDELHLYCKGIDRRDFELVRSCFADDHYHDHGGLTGSADDFVAYHRIEAGDETGLPVPTGGKATDWIVAGRYLDEMELRDGTWLIIKRLGVHDWERYDEARD